jgi:hypothetical protein
MYALLTFCGGAGQFNVFKIMGRKLRLNVFGRFQMALAPVREDKQ